MNKGENMQVFLFDVIEYIKYADKRYMRNYCYTLGYDVLFYDISS